MPNFEQIKSEVEKIIINSRCKTDWQHANLTLEWVLKIKPDVDEALKIAAYAHDIERGVPMDNRPKHEDFSNYDEYKVWYATRCSQLVEDLLIKMGCEDKFVAKVKHLVQNHEVGGDDESNVLKDADSISFILTNLGSYTKEYGIKKAKEKIDYMYNRMTDRGKQVAKELFEERKNNLY